MKILVFSDTHGNTDFMTAALHEHKDDTDLIIHLGNDTSDTRVINTICGHIASIFIVGNYDNPLRGAYDEHTFLLGNTGILAFACHGHTYRVNNDTRLLYMKARQEGAKIALYGHTHIAEISENNGIYIINPGSCSRPRGTEPASYAVIRIEDGCIMPSIIYNRG